MEAGSIPPGQMARFMFYSHDSFGLGHLRRTLALASAVTELDPEANSLILTGSTVASSYRLPPRVDTVKLPAVTKNGRDYRPLRLAGDFGPVQAVRSELALAAAHAFRPDVAVVDKSPLGLRAELRPALRLLRHGGDCRLVLGLRDIDDSPAKVRGEWLRGDLRAQIQRYYDQILVYGPDDAADDALSCLGWNDIGPPIEHVGYVASPIPVRAPPGLPDEYLLVTVGGGGDGFRILTTFLEAVWRAPLPCPAVIVTGPLMDDVEARTVDELSAGLPVQVEEFRADMEAVIGGARAVVAMAGYNTVAELMEARKPCLLVPRVEPREEQLLRARGLASSGLASMLHPDSLDPSTLRAALEGLLARPAPQPDRRWHSGATRSAEILIDLARRSRLDRRGRRSPVPRPTGATA
jgi:predicted glycosyltransferase